MHGVGDLISHLSSQKHRRCCGSAASACACVSLGSCRGLARRRKATVKRRDAAYAQRTAAFEQAIMAARLIMWRHARRWLARRRALRPWLASPHRQTYLASGICFPLTSLFSFCPLPCLLAFPLCHHLGGRGGGGGWGGGGDRGTTCSLPFLLFPLPFLPSSYYLLLPLTLTFICI